MPGAICIRGATDGGMLKGGAPRTIWQTLGSDPRTVSARSAAQRLEDGPVTWYGTRSVARSCSSSPWSGPAGPSAGPSTSTTAPERLPHRRHAQRDHARAGCASRSVSSASPGSRLPPARWPALQEILDWLDSWGMPRTWPAGRPAPFPHGHASYRNRRLWARGGHFGASQVPDWTAAGPGAVDVERLTGRRRAAALPDPAPQHTAAHVAAAQAARRQAAGLSELAEIFDSGAPATSSLTRVG